MNNLTDNWEPCVASGLLSVKIKNHRPSSRIKVISSISNEIFSLSDECPTTTSLPLLLFLSCRSLLHGLSSPRISVDSSRRLPLRLGICLVDALSICTLSWYYGRRLGVVLTAVLGALS